MSTVEKATREDLLRLKEHFEGKGKTQKEERTSKSKQKRIDIQKKK